ncbi:galectin-3-like isoform X2 [Rhinatrema bivittatum]|uniref:galectin-3-like isoform X2 n=1 Tax=Rhinatrema bivittatum TaxID=194408 RepID=UPI00112D273D|nr:galectin-3-like isoform X2 [Rhinatrema bivittatum]
MNFGSLQLVVFHSWKRRKMADDFSLSDALSGNTQNSNQQQQNQGWPSAPWGFQNPAAGQYGPGAPAPHPGAWPTPGQPGSFPWPTPGQPGSFPGPTPGQPGSFPGPTPGQPGFPQPSNPFGAPVGPQSGASSIPLTIPYDQTLSAGVTPRLLITVKGEVKTKPSRFIIDLRSKDDIAFHFNPRFDERRRAIVRNSMINNCWGKEERHTPKFPFEPGKPFKIQILCDTDHFKVAVNNEHLLQYDYRVKALKEIDKLHITGDITLTGVELTTA